MASEQRIPVFFCIDVETDDRPASRRDRQPFEGFRATWDFLDGYRSRLEDATGGRARFCWFLRMDPQIEEVYGKATHVVDAHPELIEKIVDRGDLIGVHPHSFRWDVRRDNWVFDRGSEEWMDHVVQTSYDAYASSLGRPFRASRFGEWWLTNRVVSLVERLGGRFDFTVEPGFPRVSNVEPEFEVTAPIPGFKNVPQEPYHPAVDDFRRSDPTREEGLWLIPLSATRARVKPPQDPLNPFREPIRALRGLGRPFRHPLRTVRPGLQRLSPWKLWKSPDYFWSLAEGMISRMERPYLGFAIPSFASLDAVQRSNVNGITEALLNRRLAERLSFTTPEDGLRELGYLDR